MPAFAAFVILAVLVVVSAVVVITRRKPVISALALAFNLVGVAGLYLLLDSQFLALLQVIVYAGAIMVLILFVIMLLNLADESEATRGRFVQRWGGLGLSAVLLLILARAAGGDWAGFGEPAPTYGTVGELGRELFTRFFYPFEAISLLLVVAMIGAVLLAKRRL